jgi:predicted nucleic acid-binding protein
VSLAAASEVGDPTVIGSINGVIAIQRCLQGRLEDAQGAFEIFALERSHAARLQSLMKQYADLPMDLADASLVILAEQLGHGRILSTDQRDFRTYRWKDRRPFENLLVTQ